MSRPTDRSRVSLEGHPFDLEDLRDRLTSPDLRVVQTDEVFYLESTTFDGLDSDVAVWEEAKRLMPRVNGAARLRSRSFRNVEPGARVVRMTPTGESRSTVLGVATLEGRSKVYAVGIKVGNEEPKSPPPGSNDEDEWLVLIGSDEDVDEALETWGARPHDWINLYKVFEIVKSRADLRMNTWASRPEISRFTHTANHQGAAGRDARHARLPQAPPKRSMTLSEGEAFVERLLEAWLRSLVAAP